VADLEAEIDTHRSAGLLDERLDAEYLASFDFGCRETFPDAKSLIILSMPQPMVQVTVVRGETTYPVIIPPTYETAADDDVQERIGSRLRSLGYWLEKVRLPEKLLAVRSGLAAYGRNNITYVPGMGSFYRPLAFVSDLPCHEDPWREAEVLERCEDCQACATACPSRAIGSERFLLHAERCITFQNERPAPFPDWVKATWHNCLVGCMICQKVCPANRKMKAWIQAGETFDDGETGLILNGVPAKQLPTRLIDKLNRLGMMSYYHVLARNLGVLMDRRDRV
jgi:epoxyqueuosine reductase